MPLRFDPAAPLDTTPPFVRWTIPLACPLRDLGDCFDPDFTERLLRGIRCYSDALSEQRVHRGVVLQRNSCAEEPLGFEANAVLQPFGGEAVVRGHCEACPANALKRNEPTALAGCVGHLVSPSQDNAGFHRDVDAALAAIASGPTLFVETRPGWFGLWINERPSAQELLVQHAVLGYVAAKHDVTGLADYLLALEAAIEHGLPLVVRAYPAGRCEGRKWIVEPHCGRCKAPWPEARRQQCRVCGQAGGRQSERIRKRMGTRPYRRLRGFMSQAQIDFALAHRSSSSSGSGVNFTRS